MFDQQTLNQLREIVIGAIRQETPKIVEEVIQSRVPGMVRDIVHEELLSFFTYQIAPQFEDIHRELAWIKNQMATKAHVEERFEKFRIDTGLKYRPAG